MRLLTGLGNPGPAYAGHRHNIGFMALDAMADIFPSTPWRDKFHGQFCEVTIGGDRTLLLKPQTFMNLSGKAVQAVMQFYKITPDNLFVFHDELDLPLGKVRVKQGGGAAGHNGLRSIDDTIGQNYWRVRLGIDHPGDKDRVTGHVLGNFTSDEQKLVSSLTKDIAETIPFLLQEDAAAFMNKLSLKNNV